MSESSHEIFHCPYCGAILQKNARYCSSCGKEVKFVECPSCRRLQVASSNFCRYCGKSLKLSAKVKKNLSKLKNLAKNPLKKE